MRNCGKLFLTLPQLSNWIVAFTTPIFLTHSSSGIYFLFGAASLLVAALCIFFMPETRGRSLEDIDAAFRKKVPSSTIEMLQPGDVDVDGSVGLGAHKKKEDVNVTARSSTSV
jgi:hypothetical protein